jgi:hypothetical protein
MKTKERDAKIWIQPQVAQEGAHRSAVRLHVGGSTLGWALFLIELDSQRQPHCTEYGVRNTKYPMTT